MPAAPQTPKETPSTPKLEIDAKPNHIAGCAIFLVILSVVLFIAIFSWWSFNDYKDAIIQISEESQSTTPIATTADGNFTALDRKIGDFSRLVEANKHASISLSKEELNLAIANYDKLSTFKGTLFITEISDDYILTQIAFEVSPGLDAARYLNGTMKLRPVIAQGSIFPIAEEIKPANGSAMPEKLTKEFPTLLFSQYRNDKDIASVFQHLSGVTLEGGQMVITSDPSKIGPEAIPKDVTMETNRGLKLFGVLAFMFATTLAFLFWYRRFKRKNATE